MKPTITDTTTTQFPIRMLLLIVSPMLLAAAIVLVGLSGMGREMMLWMPDLALGVTAVLGALGTLGIAASIVLAAVRADPVGT